MRKLLLALLLAVSLLSQPFSQISQAAPRPNEEAPTMPKVGDMAPDFKMSYFDGHELKEVTLSQYRGKQQVVLAFYIFAFTGG